MPFRVTRQESVKTEKFCFQTVNVVQDGLKPQNRIPGKILTLLDTQDLSVRQKLPKLDIAIFAICHCQLPFLAMSKNGYFYLHTSAGGLKVSEFNQESISEVSSLLR